MELKTGNFAVSKAGHDKGKPYLVIGLTEGRAFLSDGKSHPKEAPKKKNFIHLQPTAGGLGAEMRRRLEEGMITDEEISCSIREWRKDME